MNHSPLSNGHYTNRGMQIHHPFGSEGKERCAIAARPPWEREDRKAAATWLVLAFLLGSVIGCGSRDDTPPAAPPDSLRQDAVPAEDNEATGPPDRDREIELVEQLLQRTDFDSAESKLKALLMVDPDDVEVVFRLASVTALRGDLAGSIELLDSIPPEHPEAGIPALGQSADRCMQLERYEDAERRYKWVLELLPLAPEAHRRLAHLYNRQGRRHEAAVHIAELCRQGNVRQDELHALINLSNPMVDDPSAQGGSAGEHRYYPIGPGAQARKLFAEKKYREAISQLQLSVASGDQHPSLVALYGRAAAEAQDDSRFFWWLTRTGEETKQFAEYWAAIGTYLALQNRHREAARALLEAIDRDPTDLRSIGRLRSALEALGFRDEAKLWEQRWKLIRDLSINNNRIADSAQPNVSSMDQLADKLDSFDRKLEGVLWRSMAAMHRKLPRQSMLELNARLREIVQSDSGFPDQTVRLCNVDLSDFPLPEIELPKNDEFSVAADLSRDQASPRPARFENVASEIGLNHAYQVASERVDFGFTVYQSMGGGVAVIDYDLDGNADLYFAQGGADAPALVGTQSNVLYRKLDGKVTDVTENAMASEYRYSTGLTVGDWNQDGFADIVIANIGANSLLINNGDGTFSRGTIDDRDDKTVLTTSLAMGDLTGDAVPDLFELNYVHDPKVSQRPIKNDSGEVMKSLTPLDFQPAQDRLITQDASGQTTFQNISNSESAARAGLGVVVGDFDHRRGNEIFVGNDIYANQLWSRSIANGDGVEPSSWDDVATLKGCAYAFNGAKVASMGVAAGDFDRNGWLDFHVTNFQDENVSLYLNDQGFFQDRNIQFGLAGPSFSVLGFGTQSIDYDNDGKLDLVVTNGHIEKAITIKAPFEQRAQLFSNLGSRFELIDVADPSGYWSRNHLGRGLVRLDFNRDGKNDFVLTHLGETSALLVNQTPTENHWLQLALVGVQSERDAIGARIQVRSETAELSEWVTAGDGFLCRNEAIVSFGLGESDVVDQITIEWPSGQRQTIASIKADQRLLVVENEPQPFAW